MGTEKARDYNDFMMLKETALGTVTKDNARTELETAKNQIIERLQDLDIDNITEIEDFYLVVARLTLAATYVAALDKADKRNTTFEKERGSIGVDDLTATLIDHFINHPQVLNLQKINQIDERYKPAKEAWAGLHSRIQLVTEAITADKLRGKLKDVAKNYQSHLENKLKEKGFNIPLKDMPEDISPITKRLITRYKTVLELNQKINDKENWNKHDVDFAKDKIKICLDNTPDWSERPYVQKLTDILTLGLKALFRSFFSKERALQNTLEQSIETPKPR